MASQERAIQHGATKRELLEAIQSAAVPGGGPTFSTGVQALMQLDQDGAFTKGSLGASKSVTRRIGAVRS